MPFFLAAGSVYGKNLSFYPPRNEFKSVFAAKRPIFHGFYACETCVLGNLDVFPGSSEPNSALALCGLGRIFFAFFLAAGSVYGKNLSFYPPRNEFKSVFAAKRPIFHGFYACETCVLGNLDVFPGSSEPNSALALCGLGRIFFAFFLAAGSVYGKNLSFYPPRNEFKSVFAAKRPIFHGFYACETCFLGNLNVFFLLPPIAQR